MTPNIRILLMTALAILAVLGWAPTVLAQGSWAMSEAACRGVTTRNDDLPWPPTASWDGVGVSEDPFVPGAEHQVSGDGWSGECWELTLCRPRTVRFRIKDLDFRPGHRYELWIDGTHIGTTPLTGEWGYNVCNLGHYGPPSDGEWTVGFSPGLPAAAQAGPDGKPGLGTEAFSPQADVYLPHVEGQVHKIRVRFAGFDGHPWSETLAACMTHPNCALKWDYPVGKVVAKGRFAYTEKTGSVVGMRSIKLQLYDRNGDGSFRTFDEWKTTTDKDGYFTFPCIDNMDTDGTLLDLMVRAFIESDSSDFEPFTQALVKPISMRDRGRGIWSFDSETKPDCIGIDPDHSVLDFKTQKPTDYNRNTVLHIYTTMLRGWDWVHKRTNVQALEMMWQTWVVWDYEYLDQSRTVGDTILVAGIASRAALRPDEADDDVLLHEFGHRVAASFGFSSGVDIQPHDGRHEILDLSGNPSAGGAWDEGWGWFFARAASGAPTASGLNDYGWDRIDPLTLSREQVSLETGNLQVNNPSTQFLPVETGKFNHQGATWEFPVAGALWDISDNASDNQSQTGKTCGESYMEDTEHTLIFKACRSKTTRVSDVYSFYHAYVEQNPDPAIAAKLVDLFCEHGIDVTQRGPGQIAQDPPPTVGTDAAFANALYSSRPNPFRVGTTIDFSLAARSRVDLDVFDVRGRHVQSLVRGEARDPGRYSVPWDGRDLTGNAVRPGVYLYRLVTDGFRAEKKLIMIP